ncbi:hypothetical protein CsatB_019477 [Cannabis sativa]|uniref:Pollen preferential protein n=2 Tax=Cannabis sativa TaxID=3483 RepID=A0ABZ3NP73_CANSA|nr:uncharacterized protein LOC115700893 [Cannabis sativa]KAF4369065.1 hypothetical protein F8388_013394 [Cannabis sativa]KAF4402383.1 hypothetical protein G4B88_012168 [Cannabis sativa]
MSNQIMLHNNSSNRRQPLLRTQNSSSRNTRLAEVAGGTAAECAAVCCCCPCGLMNLLFLAIYKLPAGLCRRAMRRKRRRQLIKKGLLPPPTRRRRCSCGFDETELQIHPMASTDQDDIFSPECKGHQVTSFYSTEESDKEVEELEKEMWERFYSTGFWRSPSQREPSSLPTTTTS